MIGNRPHDRLREPHVPIKSYSSSALFFTQLSYTDSIHYIWQKIFCSVGRSDLLISASLIQLLTHFRHNHKMASLSTCHGFLFPCKCHRHNLNVAKPVTVSVSDAHWSRMILCDCHNTVQGDQIKKNWIYLSGRSARREELRPSG